MIVFSPRRARCVARRGLGAAIRHAGQIRPLATIVALALALALAAPMALAAGSVNLLSVLAAQITKAKTGDVRVLLPSRLNAGVPASRLYGSGGATAHGYDIQLAAAPGCHDSTACFVAEFWGGPGKLGAGAAVTLSKGIAGRFVPSRCGASCAPAQIEWLEFGSRYTMQFTAGRAAMVALADSAITAGRR